MTAWILILYILVGAEPIKEEYHFSTVEECIQQLDEISKQKAEEYQATVLGMCIENEPVSE